MRCKAVLADAGSFSAGSQGARLSRLAEARRVSFNLLCRDRVPIGRYARNANPTKLSKAAFQSEIAAVSREPRDSSIMAPKEDNWRCVMCGASVSKLLYAPKIAKAANAYKVCPACVTEHWGGHPSAALKAMKARGDGGGAGGGDGGRDGGSPGVDERGAAADEREDQDLRAQVRSRLAQCPFLAPCAHPCVLP